MKTKTGLGKVRGTKSHFTDPCKNHIKACRKASRSFFTCLVSFHQIIVKPIRSATKTHTKSTSGFGPVGWGSRLPGPRLEPGNKAGRVQEDRPRRGHRSGKGLEAPKPYIFHYSGARRGISLLSQKSLIRSPSEAGLWVFP